MQQSVLCIPVIAFLLCLCDYAHAAVLHSYPTAKLTVSGAVQPGDNGGNIQVDFNGFVEVIHYGPFSTASSLASGLAAMFSRDFIGFGLYAQAGASNGSDPTVVTFQLTNGSTFGIPNISGPSTSFSFSESGFGGSASGTPDVGTVSLQFNGATMATASYGEGSTPTSIAAELVQTAKSGQVTVTAEGPNLYLQTKQTGTFSSPYNLVFTSTQAGFSQSSFSANPLSGTLTGSSATSAVPIYHYSIPIVSGYDPTGNISNVFDSVVGTWSFGYDNLDRLTTGVSSSGTYSGQSACWGYDSFGNRTSQSVSTTSCGNNPPATFATAYNANNQIMSVSTPVGINITYDAAGNMTNDGYNSYLYDADGRMCAMHGPQGMVGYLYNAEGYRVGKGMILNMNSCDPTQNGFVPTTDYVLDQSGGQMAEVVWANGTSTPQHTNVMANGVLIATDDSEGWHFHLSDPLGSRRVQTNAAGFPEQICQSLPFGDQLFCTGSVDHPTEHHFTGKERDTESGLDNFGARYYGSNMGRFMSPDPLKITEDRVLNPSTLNLYSYAANNPLKYVDPDGQDITYFYDQGGIAGHAILFAYNQQTGDGAIESFGPIVHSPIAAGQSMFDLGPGVTADQLRQTYAALTIQVSPELTQQVIDYIRANPDPSNWRAFGPNCSTQCSKILQKFKLEMSRNSGKRPKVLWDALRQQYNPNAPAKPTGGLDYGAPRRDMFGAFYNQIQQNFKDDPVEGTPKKNTAPPCLMSRDTGNCV